MAPQTLLTEDCSGLGVGGEHEFVEGSCFDVQSSIHRKPCPAKIDLWGSYGSLGGSQPVGGSTRQGTHIPAKNRTRWARASCGPGARPIFFLSRPCATGPESRDHRRQNYSTLEPSQPDPSCSTTTTQLRWPFSMLQPTTLRPFLTLQTHDESLPYPLLVRPGRRIRERRRRQQRQ